MPIQSPTDVLEYDFCKFLKSDHACIDGFPQEGNTAVVVLPQPMRGGYVYQGLKPAVIVFEPDDLEDKLGDDLPKVQEMVEAKQ